MDSQKMKQLILKGVKAMVKPILGISIIAIILVSSFFGIIDGVLTTAAKVFNDIIDNINIVGDNLVIDEEYLSDAKEQLERQGINSSTLGLGNNEEYLDRFLEAEIVTNFPYLGGDGLQGAVYFERRNPDGSTKQLEYISYDEFYKKVDNGESLTDYFTVDQEDWTVHIVKIDGNIEKINYKNMVEKFAMPFEFPIALAMTTQNPQFALAVVNLVKDSRITITIAESKTTTTTTVTEHYDQRVVKRTPGEEGEPSKIETISESKEQGSPQVTTDVSYSTEIFLSNAKTWILNVVTDLQYDNSSEDLEPVEETINPVVVTEKEEQEDGTAIIITKSNRKNVTETHIEYNRWIKGTSKVLEKADNFINLIIRKKTVNGQGLLAIAEQCHDYVSDNGFTYLQDYTKNTIPISESGNKTIDCSSYVSWVLYEAGYEDLKGAQHSTADSSFGVYGDEKGWERIESIDDIQPGDICFWAKEGEPYHVNIFVSEESGRYMFWDCGWNGAIESEEPIQWTATGDFYYAFRPNDEIANALNPKSKTELKKQIENYIEGITDGKYSVSVNNLDRISDTIYINNNSVKSNGLIKIFIMAAAYNEVRLGHINEEDIQEDIRNMITTDNNSSTNNLLKTMGNGEIVKGVDKVNSYVRQNRYTNTKLEGELDNDRMVDGNEQTYTTTRDVATILKKIYNGTCVNKIYADKMLEMLKGQMLTDMIPSTISGAQIASKSGEQNQIVQDAAIISTENANYLMVISASELSNLEDGKNRIREIANIINVYYAENGDLNGNENFEVDDEIETRMNGDRVCYKLSSGEFQCPLQNLVESREMLFDLLGKFEKTQNHERLMRYLLYLLTGNNYGVTEFDFNEFLNGTFYEVGGLVGSTPEEKVWWALIDAGYSKEATAGVMGNIYAESGFNSELIEVGNGIGFGLCQWSYGRRTQLENYATSKGISPSDINTQIEFLLGELTPGGGANGYATYNLMTNHGYTANDWKNASTPETAAEIFCWIFERPGIPRMEVRTSAARRYYDQFKDAERPETGTNGSLLQAADNVARYLLDNNYTYLGTGSANYTFPIANSGLRTLSCSSYVQECLLQAGYSGASGGEKLWARGANKTAAINDLKSVGINAVLLDSMYEVQPGDIIQFSNGWPGGYHVVIAYSVSGGNIQRKGVAEVMNPNLGNNSSQGAAGFDGKTAPISSYQNNWGCYALRITN